MQQSYSDHASIRGMMREHWVRPAAYGTDMGDSWTCMSLKPMHKLDGFVRHVPHINVTSKALHAHTNDTSPNEPLDLSYRTTIEPTINRHSAAVTARIDVTSRGCRHKSECQLSALSLQEHQKTLSRQQLANSSRLHWYHHLNVFVLGRFVLGRVW